MNKSRDTTYVNESSRNIIYMNESCRNTTHVNESSRNTAYPKSNVAVRTVDVTSRAHC